MADQDLLLPRRPFAVLPPEPGGFEDALARGRRRRRRNTGGGVLASVIALALAVSLTGSSPDADAQLFVAVPDGGIAQDATVPGPADAAEDVAEIDDDQLDEVAQPDADGAPGGVDRGTVGDLDREPATTGAADAPGRSTGRQPAVSRGRTPTPLSERVDDDGYLDCAANGIKFGRWCLQAMHRISDIASGDATLSLLQCLSVDATGPATLVYPTLQQVDFEVTRAGSDVVLWQWAYGAIFADERTEDDVSPGACRVYEVIWPEGRTDNNNRRIPEEGEYTLTARSFAAILGDENSASVTFTISNSQ